MKISKDSVLVFYQKLPVSSKESNTQDIAVFSTVRLELHVALHTRNGHGQ